MPTKIRCRLTDIKYSI